MSASADIAAEARRRIKMARKLDKLETMMRAELDGDWQTDDGTTVAIALRSVADLIASAPFREEVGREPTGDDVAYGLGDHEPCIDCGDGTAHVVTTKMGAAYEQGIALGMSKHEAWERAQEVGRG